MARKKRRIGWIGDGGGFAGAHTIGFAKAALERCGPPVYCQGVSVNALTFAKIVEDAGDVRGAEAVWIDTERKGAHAIFDTKEIFLRGFWSSSLFCNDGVKRLISHVDCNAVVRSPISFDIVTINERSCHQVVFSTREPEILNNPLLLPDVILASASLAGFLEPVLINGDYYSDGKAILIERAIQSGCDTVFIFLNDALDDSTHEKAKRHAHEIWFRRLFTDIQRAHEMLVKREIVAAQSISHNLRAFEKNMALLDNTSRLRRLFFGDAGRALRFTFEGKEPVDIVIFRPVNSIPSLWTIGFKKGDIAQAIRNGYKAGTSVLDEYLRSS